MNRTDPDGRADGDVSKNNLAAADKLDAYAATVLSNRTSRILLTKLERDLIAGNLHIAAEGLRSGKELGEALADPNRTFRSVATAAIRDKGRADDFGSLLLAPFSSRLAKTSGAGGITSMGARAEQQNLRAGVRVMNDLAFDTRTKLGKISQCVYFAVGTYLKNHAVEATTTTTGYYSRAERFVYSILRVPVK